jgi:hypothetical protein
MADQTNDATPEDVVEHFQKSLPASSCTKKCHDKYLRDLANCKGDRDCIARATGHYVICVLSCRGK